MRRVRLSSIPGGKRTLVVAGIVCVVLLAVVSMPQLMGSDVRRAFGGLEHARPVWLWAASVGFLGALLCNAWVWRCAIQFCGGRVGPPPPPPRLPARPPPHTAPAAPGGGPARGARLPP